MVSPHVASKSVSIPRAFTGVFTSFWRNRRLILQLVRREFEGRFRGSSLGLLWSLLQPLALLVVYTFVFSQVFQARWSVTMDHPLSFALVLFAGLIAFNLFAENFNAAPRIVLQNVAYIKKVVFPLEVLPWVSLLTALITAAISTMLLLFFYIAVFGLPPLTSLFVPLVVIPLCLGTLGASWFLSSIGVFLRDIQHGTAIATTILLFLSPIFYPVSAVPESFRRFIYLNPLTEIIEMVRGAIFFNQVPPLFAFSVSLVVSWSFAAAGYWWFMKVRKGFADVV